MGFMLAGVVVLFVTSVSVFVLAGPTSCLSCVFGLTGLSCLVVFVLCSSVIGLLFLK